MTTSHIPIVDVNHLMLKIFPMILTRVDGVDDGKGNEHSSVGIVLLDAVYAQRHVEEDTGQVFPAVHKMWEHISRIPVTADTLQRTPYGGHSCQHSNSPGMVRIASGRTLPVIAIKAEEQCNILCGVNKMIQEAVRNQTYAHCICERAEHIAHVEVSEFNRIETSKH